MSNDMVIVSKSEIEAFVLSAVNSIRNMGQNDFAAILASYADDFGRELLNKAQVVDVLPSGYTDVEAIERWKKFRKIWRKSWAPE